MVLKHRSPIVSPVLFLNLTLRLASLTFGIATDFRAGQEDICCKLRRLRFDPQADSGIGQLFSRRCVTARRFSSSVRAWDTRRDAVANPPPGHTLRARIGMRWHHITVLPFQTNCRPRFSRSDLFQLVINGQSWRRYHDLSQCRRCRGRNRWSQYRCGSTTADIPK
jgi:hypothetical protein